MIFKYWNYNTGRWRCVGDVAEYEHGHAWLRRDERHPNRAIKAFCTKEPEKPVEGGGQSDCCYETHETVISQELWELALEGPARKVALVYIVLRDGRERIYAMKTEMYMMTDEGKTIARIV